MAARIRSLALAGPLLVPLASGGSVRLSPGEVSDELADVEVTNNPKIDKLRDRRLVVVESTSEEAGDEADTEAGEAAAGPAVDAEPKAAARTPRRSSRSRSR
jgi:hypothetical protein